MRIITVLGILLSFTTVAQKSVSGTMVIASIGSDCIVIAADSRMHFEKNDSTIYHYIDNFKKIFIADRFAVAFIEDVFFYGYSAEYILNDFSKLKVGQFKSPQDFLVGLINFMQEKYKAIIPPLESIICCGYDDNNGKPVISFYHKDKVALLKQTTPYISDVTEQIFRKKYHAGLSSKELKKLSIRAIDSFPIINKGYRNKIGGYVSVLKISANSSFSWLTDTTKLLSFNTVFDEIRYYFKNKKAYHILRPDLTKEVEKELKELLNEEKNLRQ